VTHHIQATLAGLPGRGGFKLQGVACAADEPGGKALQKGPAGLGVKGGGLDREVIVKPATQLIAVVADPRSQQQAGGFDRAGCDHHLPCAEWEVAAA
jgi:hypothetical protein